MLCALIMAGGKGTRFWPLSTEKKPKQFLNLLGEETMIQMTVKRLLPLIPIERIFIVTGRQYFDLVRMQLPDLPEGNIILEPYGRNTAPCIALSAFYINKKYKNAVLAVLPSDHLIKNEEEFLKILSSAEKFVDKKEDSIVTIGIKPDRPDTGYGYINYGQSVDYINGSHIMPVNKFVEKPNEEKAREYLNKGSYLWNAGMFIWNINNILSLTNKYLKRTYEALSEIAAAGDKNYEAYLNEKYNNVDNISIDYGILEKYDSIYVIPGSFGWDDVGGWKAVERYLEKDEDNNICKGKVKSLKSKNNIIIGNGKPIVISGIDNIVMIESDDLIFIGKKEDIKYIDKIKKDIATN